MAGRRELVRTVSVLLTLRVVATRMFMYSVLLQSDRFMSATLLF
jgi:hypothetical protein